MSSKIKMDHKFQCYVIMVGGLGESNAKVIPS